ncbi:DEAD/DEAH box helicase family protein [Psychromonas sp. SA13A]|uniref:DEAD/DEAH box helicase n=1 Tax=Psychromonas sp. SA13A TaxID=2686346 RepID=UPI00140A1EB5|nr:DEAD/DEAH box helicase family protein [Psychromonas sp. SA13A]
MKLRTWQQECITLALKKFKSGGKHFLGLATPGAGKTFMASSLGETLYSNNEIDLVICFSPSSIVANDFKESLSTKFLACFEGKIGSIGQSLTYQHMQFLDNDFWSLFKRFRVFVIFDEIHHCKGSCVDDANSWGEQIILNIQDKAKYSIALTGTPWRSDAAPIVLSQYCGITNEIECDYIYGLESAITDNVCRIPQIIAIDNDKISVTENEDKVHFTSFLDLLSTSILPYSDIIKNEKVIEHVISSANRKLDELRLENPDAGGLIVASSVLHAKQIQGILANNFNQNAVVVTYRETESVDLIKQYRSSSERWIISVGMISEGTNIPRLQVCCHLTNIKTEMHYRQILGRILRITSSANQEAVMYMPAEPKLVEFANRVGEDVSAEAGIVRFEKMHVSLDGESPDDNCNEASLEDNKVKHTTFFEVNDFTASLDSIQHQEHKNPLTQSYDKMVNIFGRFKLETIELNLFNIKN